MRDRTHDEAMAEVFRNDPAYALELLDSILQEGEQGWLIAALRQMTKAGSSPVQYRTPLFNSGL
jgi:DNA-binding phage protein